jgi:hypothetical protein
MPGTSQISAKKAAASPGRGLALQRLLDVDAELVELLRSVGNEQPAVEMEELPGFFPFHVQAPGVDDSLAPNTNSTTMEDAKSLE